MLIILGVLIFSVMLAFNLPVLYASAKLAAAESSADTTAEPERVRIRPFMAVLILCSGVIPVWMMTHNPMLTLFILMLGSAAYIDYVTQWVPDILIFILSWVSLVALLPGGPNSLRVLAGAAVMILPAIALNLFTWQRSQPTTFASGDLYILPAVGLWLAPEWAGVCMAISLMLTFIACRYVREVPFITVLFPVFVVVSICGA
ncbi:prepilin peptidase [Mixta mediterraneensis]|uniref:prepilin peptidase n=1 Tax=Mixta mediterraneensis TaxID=2758443 RepID=UPI0018771FF6|nr:prepilin peptidase [Mixta mediterraneensis]MBE5254669.1 prepilin peptidase [Mixta mediterraneensis]